MESNSKLYDEPTWSSKPINEFHLEVLKDGSIIQKIPLFKSYTLLGRQSPDMIDILLEHPSISRLHAVLNFREDGSLMLRDLNSAQGTFLNKTLCDKNIYYRVYVGDIIKFGQSTRKYILEGPEEHRPIEYSSINLEQYREKLILQSEKIKKIIQADQECSWGFNDSNDDDNNNDKNNNDDNNVDNDKNSKKVIELPDYLRKDENYDRKYNDKYIADVNLKDIKNQKDQEIYDKIKKKELKIQNMQEEIRRIYIKEPNQENGLTSGQLATIQRNDDNVLQLTEEIHQMIKQLKLKEQDRQYHHSNNNNLKRKNVNNDIDSDLIDITSNNIIDIKSNWRLRKKLQKNMNYNNLISNNTNEALSYHDIKEKLNKQSEVINESYTYILKLQEQLKLYKDNMIITSKNNNDDQVQHVIFTNQYEEVKTKLKNAFIENNEFIQIQNNLNQLLQLATPALLSLVQEPTTSTITTNNNNINTTNNVTHTSNNNIKNTSISKVSSDNDNSNTYLKDKLITTKQPVVIPSFNNNEEENKEENITPSLSQHLIKNNNLEELKRFIEKEKALELSSSSIIINKQQIGDAVVEATNSSSSTNDYGGHSNDGNITKNNKDHTNSMINNSTTNNSKHNQISSKTKVTATTATDNHHGSSRSMIASKDNKVTSLSFNHNVLEGGDYNWLPPKQQTGDGKTKLNAKYGY